MGENSEGIFDYDRESSEAGGYLWTGENSKGIFDYGRERLYKEGPAKLVIRRGPCNGKISYDRTKFEEFCSKRMRVVDIWTGENPEGIFDYIFNFI